MRICLIARTMPAHRGGRGMFHPFILGEGLAKRGHKVVALTTARTDGVKTEHVCDGFRVIYLEDTPPDRYSDEFWHATAQAFDRLNAGEAFDLVGSDSDSAYGWAMHSEYRSLVPLVVVKHNSLSMINKMARFRVGLRSAYAYSRTRWHNHRWFQEITKPLLLHSSRVLCVSKAVRDALATDYAKVTPKLDLVYNGVDMRQFQSSTGNPEKLASQLNPGDAPLICYVGRLVPPKGLSCLLKALARLREERFAAIIVGRGSSRYVGQLEAEIRQLGLEQRVNLVPGVAHDQVPSLLNMSDLFVLPSYMEGFPFALLEAFACRLPVVATRVGGVREIVKDGVNGYMVAKKNPRALAGKLAVLLQDAALRRRMGQAGYEMVARRFSLERMLDDTEALFRNVAASSYT